ncbi:hypothetical protein HYG86_15745 [Alkalicella caledoniensis]|uniref:DUF7305 domain-containing protein n=1 Tax=Alkalicella caledoniensis TaxID=2731377 RepID=A0A7G9WBQ5_ALKCA|nr:hypothetical protein [Alkalicella caledoniensis]QNO16117.1 hypothetical protein HYG86_15745 [Alkalicella caledoniensis]
MNPSISKSQINYGFKIHGQVKTSDEPLTFSMPNFPVFPNLPIHPNMVEGTHNVIAEGNLNITNYQVANFTLHLNSDYKFNQINMNSGRTLNINIGNQDRVIVVEQLNIENGFINILGTGKLTIYVNNNITFNNGRINSEDKTQNLTIYLKGSGNPSHPKVVNISGSQKIYASLYAEDADVQLFNSGGFQGNIITGGKNVNLSGSATANVRAIYAPNAKVSVDAGANVKGVVISNEFSMSGNTTLEYTDVKGDPFLESLFGGNVSYKPIWK